MVDNYTFLQKSEVNPYSNVHDQTYFYPTHYEVIMNIRGFRPRDIKINVTNNKIQVLGQKSIPPIQHGNYCSQKQLTMHRNYDIVKSIIPHLTQCVFSDDGTHLKIMAPWL